MGQSSKAIIRKDLSLETLKTFLEKTNHINVIPTNGNDYYRLIINDNSVMSVFINDYALYDYKIDGILLTHTDIELLTSIVSEFGGFIRKDDEDFTPVNIEKFNTETTERDKMINEIITKLGYSNLEKTLKIFDKYVHDVIMNLEIVNNI